MEQKMEKSGKLKADASKRSAKLIKPQIEWPRVKRKMKLLLHNVIYILGGKEAWIQEYRFSDSSQYPINSLLLKDLKTGHNRGRRGGMNWDIYTTVCETDSLWEFDEPGKPKPALCDNLEEVGWEAGGRGIQADTCRPNAVSCWYMAKRSHHNIVKYLLIKTNKIYKK